ncbi:hypothetical protein BH09ACT8_BH09ACT8_61040 [soil metagenome]
MNIIITGHTRKTSARRTVDAGAPRAIAPMAIIRWLFIAAIGWVLFLVLFRTESHIDPDAAEPKPAADDP